MIDFTRIRGAIVDLDGTMVDTLGDFHAALGDAFERLHLPAVDHHSVEGFIGKGSEHLVRSALAHVGARVDDAAVSMALDTYQVSYRRCNGTHATVYPGVVEGLRAMTTRGWRLACVTNKPREFALDLLRSKGLLDFFERVHGGDDFARRKPDPMPLIETTKAMGLQAEFTLMVGDSVNDARAARGAGMPVLLLSYGYNHGESVRDLMRQGLADDVWDRMDEGWGSRLG